MPALPTQATTLSPLVSLLSSLARDIAQGTDAETRLPLQMTIAQETWVDRTVTEVTLRQ